MPNDFILRNIPPSLHQDWKNFSEKRGFSMRNYLLVSLMKQVEKDKLLAGRAKDDRNSE